nr:hypothetical protein [uncultured Tyzzerella sp.]
MINDIDLDSMRNMDIKTINTEDLVDINKIDFDENLLYELKVKDFLEKIKNPFYYKVGNVIVHNIYNEPKNNVSITQCFEENLKTL